MPGADNVAVDLIGAAGTGPGLYLIGLSQADAARYAQPRLCAVVVEANGHRESLGEVPIQDAFDFTPATLIGPVPLGDTPAETAPVDPFPVIEERLHARLSQASALLTEQSADHPYYSHEARELVEAIQRVRALQPPPVREQLVDEDLERRVVHHVWAAMQEDGEPTIKADRVVEHLRAALRSER